MNIRKLPVFFILLTQGLFAAEFHLPGLDTRNGRPGKGTAPSFGCSSPFTHSRDGHETWKFSIEGGDGDAYIQEGWDDPVFIPAHINGYLYHAVTTGKTCLALEILKDHPNVPWNLGVRFGKGWTLLHYAANFGNSDLVLQLISLGMDVGKADHFRDTPLHIAARMDHAACVLALSAMGAGLDSRNVDKKTPLHLAVEGDCLEAVKILLRLGADKDMADSEGKKPPDYADTREMKEALENPVEPDGSESDPAARLFWEKVRDDIRLYGSDRERAEKILGNQKLGGVLKLKMIKILLQNRGFNLGAWSED